MEIECALPTKLVNIRAARRKDLDLIASWFTDGCYRGSAGQVKDVHTLEEYQERMQFPDWQYQCMIIEDQGQAVGYLDYRYRSHLGEILGVSLETHLCEQRVDLHLLRWTLTFLRHHGCHTVVVTLEANKRSAIDRCLAVGFYEQQNDACRGTSTVSFQYDIPPLLYLSPPKLAYTLLRGENWYLHHAALASCVTHALQELPGVQAVLGLGSLFRQFGDVWSDLDLAVLGSGPDLAGLWRGERYFAGIDFDLFVVDLESSPPQTWDDARLQAFEESVVLFARDARIIQLLQQAVKFDEQEQKMKIAELLLLLGWIGFQPRAWYDQHKYGYFWSVPYDLWMRRGSTASAHTTVERALDLTMQLLFLANGQRIPDAKWRRFLVPHLAWLPPDFLSLLSQAETDPRNEEGFLSRAKATLMIVEGVVSYLETMGKIHQDLYKIVLRRISDYL